MSSPQLKLFRVNPQANDISEIVEHNHIPVRRSTFLGGLASRVHRWFRLTPSFGPELVQEALRALETQPHSTVFDPFAGAGTTLIEAKLEGHRAIGCEINPFLSFVCKASLDWSLDASQLSEHLARVRQRFADLKSAADSRSVHELGLSLPPIHNVSRWWRPDVLVDLLLLLKAIRAGREDSRVTRFFELALAGVLVPDLTNVTLGRLQLHFIVRDNDRICVWETFEKHALTMIRDVCDVSRSPAIGRAEVYEADCTSPNLAAKLPPIDRVVTSPPYPNRYSYVWNTRPHLYLFGFFNTPKQAGDLDIRTIGGTWGTATSALAKGRIPAAYPIVHRVVGPVVEKIRTTDNLMANYLMKYFNQLAHQIMSQDELLSRDARMAYVVGCSRLKGVYVETDILLAQVFEGLKSSYKVTGVERFRRRHSGKDLHESIVYVRLNRTARADIR